jgi:hypothetical protein
MNQPISPTIDALGVPRCGSNACPSFESCTVADKQPETVCVPAVQEMAAQLRRTPTVSDEDRLKKSLIDAAVKAAEAGHAGDAARLANAYKRIKRPIGK